MLCCTRPLIRWPSRLTAAIGLVVWLAPPAVGQERIIIDDDDVSCRTCDLRVERVGRIGKSRGDGMLPTPRSFSLDSRGRYYFVSYGSPGEIFIYGKDGQFLRSVLREGNGPGEFIAIDVIHVSRGDTIYAFDGRNIRNTILTPELELVRTALIPGQVDDAVTLDDGRVVISAWVPTRESVGLPLHVLASDGTIARSFGAEGELFRPDLRSFRMRRLEAAGSNRFWAAHMIRYVLELWDANGIEQREIVRQVDWFPPRIRIQSPTREEPPSPVLHSIHLDDDGLLWVLIGVPEKDWHEGLRERPRTREGTAYAIVDIEKVFGSVIEVIDPRTGELIYSERFEHRFGEFIEDGTLVSMSHDDNGVAYLDLWRVRLTR